MKVNWNNFKKLPISVSMLLFNVTLIGILATMGAAPARKDLSARKIKTPTPTPTAISTPTQTPAPYFTPTPGPTTTVDGTWKIVMSPNVGTGTYGNQLHAVAVVSASDVWAVGFSPDPNGTPLYIRRTLIEHWNGGSWSVIPSPNPGTDTYVELNGVASISANDIWAVGHSGDPGSIPLKTLTEHWNGTSWSIIPSPNPGTYNGNVLNAVAAVSANDVWAVGWYQSGSTGQEGGALTMHWNGTQWAVVPNPSRSTLYGVTALSSNNVWAVGDQVILHWDGSNWSNVTLPLSANGSSPFLRGISAVSANEIWAVGYFQWSYFEGTQSAPASYHWNGTSWSWIPNAGNVNEYFFAVAAIAANDVWAVGDNGQTQHWNGADWSRVAAPYPGLGGRSNGVAAASHSDVWAVGSYTDGNQWLTWIDRYTVP